MKTPHSLFPSVFAFPPHRKTLGGTAYFIQDSPSPHDPNPNDSSPNDPSPNNPNHNILVDCPPWTPETAEFLQQRGGVRWLFLTHRNAIADVGAIQAELGCEVVIQEQEAYLLPEIPTQVFQREIQLGDRAVGFWTPGHSPGSACLYWAGEGGILFSGRHLLPNPQGELAPLRTSKTFHWPRQLRSVQTVIDRFNAKTLSYICPGANVGFLRGKGMFDQACTHLAAIAAPSTPSPEPYA